MSGSLSIATRALNVNLSALQVIGHNIANVNTEGYSRQNVQLQVSDYQQFGNGFFGKGVELTTVTRAHSEYLTREASLTKSVASADGVRLAKLQQLEAVFPTGETGLGSAMNNMLNAWADVASSPSNLTARLVVISRADELATRMRNTAGQIDQLASSSELQVKGSVSSINRLAQDLAAVNQRILETRGQTHTPNDLLDQRDQLVSELNKYIQTTTVAADDGTLSVFVGGSQPLVLGQKANSLAATRDATDPSRVTLSFMQAGVSTSLDDKVLGGGELAGLMGFLHEDLTNMQNQLGRMALALASEMNEQHKLGIDLKGAAGADFFVPPANAPGLAENSNTGNATLHAEVADPTALRASDYELRFDAAGVNVVRLSDGQSTAFASLPAVVDGLRFQIDAGAANVGDRFRLRPYAAVARDLAVAIGSPDRLAASSPVLVQPGATNTGGMGVENLYAVSPSANLTDPVTLTFLADGSFTATGLGPGNPPPDNVGPPASYNYSPGQRINFNGWSLSLRGSPAAGDSFSISAAPPGSTSQNAGNAGAMLALREQPTFEGVALADGYTSLFSSLGTRVQSAKFSSEFSAQVATATESARSGVAGVNLDEEAARLLQFQQSYQAAAKFLQIAQSTFDTLMQTVGR
jgi:flagellar hook-associated protein 1